MFAHPARARQHALARHRRAPVQQYAGVGTGIAVAGGVGLIFALALVPTFVVAPWIVKAIKPEWSYGRRLGASLAFGFVAGTLVSVARGLGGSDTNVSISALPATTS